MDKVKGKTYGRDGELIMKDQKQLKVKVKINYLRQLVFPFLLFIYPLWNINQGLDISDTSYNLGNYEILDVLDKMWYFSTYLAQEIGALLTKLPFGEMMIGMNFYTSLFISITALLCYFFLYKKIPYGIVFVGEIISISLCWCPSVILYNYLSYLLFTLGAIMLYHGLAKGRIRFLIMAGIALGLNVLVRFPNILEAALILSLWYYGWLKRKKFLDILKETGLCLIGYLIGIGSVMAVVIVKFGFNNYIEGITELFLMNKTATSYTPKEMVMSIIREYYINAKWLLGMIALTIAGVIAFRIWDSICKKGKYAKIPKVIYVISVMVLIRWYYAKGMFNVKYYTYESMRMWATVFLIVAIICSLTMIFSKKSNDEEKLMWSILLIIIGITPLGSNNYLYPNYNNMFLVAPATLAFLWKILRSESKFTPYSVKVMLVIMTTIFLIQSFGFGMTFVYRDGMLGEKRDTKIENNDILKGMYTTAENASAIEEVQAFLEEADLIESKVIISGGVPGIPGIAYFLGMQPAISSTWPDLPSYQLDTFEEELVRVGNEIETDRPIFILSEKNANRIQKAIENDKMVEEAESDQELVKLNMVREFFITYNYQEIFSNNMFILYE